jgi:hypothetical protein
MISWLSESDMCRSKPAAGQHCGSKAAKQVLRSAPSRSPKPDRENIVFDRIAAEIRMQFGPNLPELQEDFCCFGNVDWLTVWLGPDDGGRLGVLCCHLQLSRRQFAAITESSRNPAVWHSKIAAAVREACRQWDQETAEPSESLASVPLSSHPPSGTNAYIFRAPRCAANKRNTRKCSNLPPVLRSRKI